MLSILVHQYVRSFQISMDGPLPVQILQSEQHLVCIVPAEWLFDLAKFVNDLLHDALTSHVLEIDAEDIVLDDLTAVILHNMVVLEQLIPVDLFFHRFSF